MEEALCFVNSHIKRPPPVREATTKSSYSGWSLTGGFYCSYNVYFITFRQNERSSKVFIKNMCSQGKKSLEMELTLILLITLI